MTLAATEHNLLFVVIAIQNDLIDVAPCLDACQQWTSNKSGALADTLVWEGALLPQDRTHVDYLLQRRLQRPGGAHRILSSIPADLRAAFVSLGDDEICAVLGRATGESRFTTSEEISSGSQPADRITRHELHSTGGTGYVWKAHDHMLGRPVALKELKAEQAGIAIIRERFFREAQITAQLTHPGTVPIYDYVEDGTRSYYTMRFVQGRTLLEAVREYHELLCEQDNVGVSSRLLQLINQFVSVCNTVAFAHSRSVIHRDLKSENVIVGDFGEVFVLDWGLAKRLDDDEQQAPSTAPQRTQAPAAGAEPEPTATVNFVGSEPRSATRTMQGDKLGTPAYMSPEQARGEVDLDPRCDVYGLAAILYEILVGEPPFLGDNVVQLLERVINDSPQPPSDRVKGIPSEIEQICLQGLSKGRHQRQASAGQLAEQISGWIAARAEQTFQDLLESAPDAMVVVDDAGKILLVNGRLEAMFGYARQELQGQPVEVLIPQASRVAHVDMVSRFIDRPKARPMGAAMALRGERKDGSLFPVDISLSPIKTEQGLLISCAIRDVSERQKETHKLQAILQSAPGALLVADAQGRIHLVNLQAERMFGFPGAELLGEPLERLLAPRFRQRHRDEVARLVRAPGPPPANGLQLKGKRKDDSEFSAEFRLSAVETRDGLMICVAARDLGESRD